MRAWLKKWWPWGKLLLGLCIIAAITLRFAKDLQEPGLWDRSLHWGWLIVSGLLYLLGVSCWALFWNRLLHSLGQDLSLAATARSYFVGQLGKYLPGKAMALVMRATMAGESGVRTGLAGLTAFYEVLTTMATGALAAAVLLFFLGPSVSGPMDWGALAGLFRLEAPAPEAMDRRVFALLALLLCAPLFFLVLPPVFNRLAHRLAAPFREKDAPSLPRFRWRLLLRGLLITGGSWFLMGLSLWAMLQAVLDQPPSLSWRTWGLLTGALSLSYVAGFIILIVPSGLGVREFFLTLFLVDPAAQGSRASIWLVVLVLRLTWTTAELLAAAAVYWRPWRAARTKERGPVASS